MTSSAVSPSQPLTFGPPLVGAGDIALADLMAALSQALDLTEGQPAGHAARTAVIGMRLAHEIGLPQEQHADLYFSLLLKDLGCSSNAAKMCYLFGADDRDVKRDVKVVDWTNVRKRLRFAWSQVAPQGGGLKKLLHVAALAISGNKGAAELIQTRCERGAHIARQFGFSSNVAAAIRSLDEHWNGRGYPEGRQGEEIPLPSRILGIAQTMEVFLAQYSPARAMEVAQDRKGKWFDPDLVAAFCSISQESGIWDELKDPDPLALLMRHAPRECFAKVGQQQLDNIALGFANVVDAKSPWTADHSRNVAAAAKGVALEMGATPEQAREIWIAGLLHDLGKLGVSNLILDKPGKPTDEEFAAIKRHPDYTWQILSKVTHFDRLADVAAAHHERIDGRGYHRQIPGDKLCLEARILAVADVFDALTAARPYRPSLPMEKVDDIMIKDAGSGLCPESLQALHAWRGRAGIDVQIEHQLETLDDLLASGLGDD